MLAEREERYADGVSEEHVVFAGRMEDVLMGHQGSVWCCVGRVRMNMLTEYWGDHFRMEMS